MKFNYFNFFVIFLFVFIILSSTALSCSKFQPHYADSIFQKHGKFEGFHDKAQTLGYAKKDDHSALDNHDMHLMESDKTSSEKVANYCKNVFGFHGLYCDPSKDDAVIDVIGKTKGTPDCVGRSSGLSKSTGGLCLNENQINLLKTRGGNMSTGEEIIGN
tara:strand:- start:496 stop:975 length:480 start_codon:yes stop_codon:yes gene_type:complete